MVKLRYIVIMLMLSFEMKAGVKPNVILIVADDLGMGDLGYYGNKLIQTPQMDAFAKQSLRFNDFHVSPTCAPSRSSFMTGKYCHVVGVHATIEGRELPFAKEQMMPEVFAQNGYSTALFGKWHLGDAYPFRPEDRGFQHLVYHHGGGVSQTPDFWGNDYFNDTYWVNDKLQKFEGYCTDIWFDEAAKYIKKSNKEKKPFFAYIATNAPHAPFRAPQKYLDLYDPTFTPAPFYGMITNIDENFGKLMKMLKEEGIEENTIVILTSDNGSNIGTYYFDAGMRGHKGDVLEGGHKVPCFMRWPKGGFDQGKDLNALTAHVDLLPTFIDLLGFKKTNVDYSGVSLKSALYGDEKSIEERSVVVTNWEMGEWESTAVLKSKWRLLDNNKLYNLEKDPMQVRNVMKSHSDIVNQLRADYKAYREKVLPDPIAYFVLGSEKQNPVPLNAHDIRVKRGKTHKQPPVVQGHIIERVDIMDEPWMVNIETAGHYEISLRRFPAELDLPIESKYKDPSTGWTGGGLQKADKAYLDIAGVVKEIPIPKGAKEVTFKVTLPKKEHVEMRAGYLVDGKRHSAHYVYVLNADIYKRNLSTWQTPKAMGLPMATSDAKDIPLGNQLIDPRLEKLKHRRLPPYAPKEGAVMKATSAFAWTSSSSNFSGGALHYVLEIATDKDFSNIIAQKDHIKQQELKLNQLSNFEPLPKNQKLFVRITALNEWGNKTDASEGVSFIFQ